jgi:hypothetical protein
MTTTMQGSEMFAQMTGRAVEAFSVLADANQRSCATWWTTHRRQEGVGCTRASSSAVEVETQSTSCADRAGRKRQDRSPSTERVGVGRGARRPSNCSRAMPRP